MGLWVETLNITEIESVCWHECLKLISRMPLVTGNGDIDVIIAN